MKAISYQEINQIFANKSVSDIAFKLAVGNIISAASKPNQAILRKLPTMNRSQTMVAFSNFYLAGEGNGVL
jgi:hypothetical protein